jgi:hypothetical protein
LAMSNPYHLGRGLLLRWEKVYAQITVHSSKLGGPQGRLSVKVCAHFSEHKSRANKQSSKLIVTSDSNLDGVKENGPLVR